MRRGTILTALASTAVLVGSAPAVGLAAAPGTVSGSLTGARVPTAATGAAHVQALRLDTGVISAGRRLGPVGGYALRLPAGPYVLVGSVANRAAGTLVTRTAAPVSLRAAQRLVTPISFAPFVVKPKAAGAGARAAHVQRSGRVTPGVTAIEVRELSGASGKLKVLNRALAEELETALARGGGGCATVVVAGARDRALIAAALKRPRSGRYTPPARSARDLVQADLVVGGRLTARPGAVDVRLELREARGGALRDASTTRVPLGAALWSRVAALAPGLLRRACTPAAVPPPAPPVPPSPAPPPSTPDTTAPVVTLGAPPNGSFGTLTTPTLSGLAGTAAGDLETVNVRVFAGTIAGGLPLQTLAAQRGAGGAFAIAAAPLGQGIFTARAEQSDAAGNTGLSAPTTFSVVSSTAEATLIGAGDISGMGASVGDEATAALLAQHPDATVFTLGDNAYADGQPAEYANFYDPTWGAHKARTRPVTGGHDTATISGGALPNQGFSDYFSAQLAPFGATATDRMKSYYSYDVGAWHVVALNSACYKEFAGCDIAAQEAWFRADLAAHPNVCTAVMWHDPRWSSGSIHGNQLYTQPLWDIAYTAGADLVLNASEHVYERFAPQNAEGVRDDVYGIRQLTVGTGGYGRYGLGTPKANSEVFDKDTYGVVKLTLRPTGYSWQFLPVAGGTFTDSGSGSCHGAPQQPAGTPTVRSSSSATAPAPATTLPISKPPGTQPGDVLLATIGLQSSATRDIAPPVGWSVVPATNSSDAGNAGMRAFYRVAGGSEPATYTFTLTGGTPYGVAGGMMAIAGADTTAPINASASQINPGATYALPTPSVTTTRPRTLLVSSGVVNQPVLSSWPPQLMTEAWDVRIDAEYDLHTSASAGGVADAGPTGPRSSTLWAPGRGVGISVAIAPAS